MTVQLLDNIQETRYPYDWDATWQIGCLFLTTLSSLPNYNVILRHYAFF